MTETISRDELNAQITAGSVTVLEALPPMYFEAEHLPTAHNLPLDDIEILAPVLIPSKDHAVVTYCSNVECANSKVAANTLTTLGYTNVRAFEGGKQDWIEAGLPVESGPVPAPR